MGEKKKRKKKMGLRIGSVCVVGLHESGCAVSSVGRQFAAELPRVHRRDVGSVADEAVGCSTGL